MLNDHLPMDDDDDDNDGNDDDVESGPGPAPGSHHHRFSQLPMSVILMMMLPQTIVSFFPIQSLDNQHQSCLASLPYANEPHHPKMATQSDRKLDTYGG